jgi:ABC-type dipeptide/oligopeptide/nickel transport system permease subunit
MLTVTFVAVARLLLGTALGLIAGWSAGRLGRALDTLIRGALAFPILLVALAVVAAGGHALRLPAFVLGLMLTGWAETARLAAEQTRMIKGLTFVEAARALGGSGSQILTGHVVRQITPLLWMVFAFEVSNTLLVTAALGFLGYYLSPDIWIPDNWVNALAHRTTGMPDLGQMMSGSIFQLYTDPWGLATAGAMVFLTVLGFNLLGEGLRLQFGAESTRPVVPVFSAVAARAGPWLERRVSAPLGERLAAPRVRLATAGLLVVALAGGGLVWWRAQNAVAEPLATLRVPGDHLWAGERRDPYGSLWTPASGPVGTAVAWEFTDASGFRSGPAVAADGTVYVSAHGGTLYALSSSGAVLWQASLAAPPAGSPALGPASEVYVLDRDGELRAYSPAGHLEWSYASEAIGSTAPIVAPDGTIYFVVQGSSVQALAPTGEPLWRADTRVTLQEPWPPRLSPDGQWLFLKNVLLDARTGELLSFPALQNVDYLYVGADGRLYFRHGNALTEWSMQDGEARVERVIDWDYRSFTVGVPRDAGVTPGGTVWLVYYSPFEQVRLVWMTTGRELIGLVRHGHVATRVVGVDGGGRLFLCGVHESEGSECVAYRAGEEQPAWRVALPDLPTGGALVPGRLYVTTGDGLLIALGD